MHSHFGLQKQMLNSAPLILQSEEQKAKADEQYVVLLSDFSFKPPGQILKELKAGMKKMKRMSGMNEMPNREKLVAQKWDDGSQRFVSATVEGELPDPDVKYDARIANRRTPRRSRGIPGQAGPYCAFAHDRCLIRDKFFCKYWSVDCTTHSRGRKRCLAAIR
jgi:hypothetical protein